MLTVLEQDFARIPELLGRPSVLLPSAPPPLEPEPEPSVQLEPAVQLGLF